MKTIFIKTMKENKNLQEICLKVFTYENRKFIFLSTRKTCIQTDDEEIKQKKGSKRIRGGGSRTITVLQMDF